MKSKFCIMLEEERNAKNLTKKQVANLMGVTPMYYARYENGYLIPTKRNLNFFAEFLDISNNELWEVIQNDKLKK